MKNKALREFDYDGTRVYFNSDYFRDLFVLRARKKNCKLGDYEIELGTKLGVSENAIHGWRNKKFGPADLDLIKKLAEEMDSDIEMFIKETDDMAIVEKYDSAVRKCVIDTYRELSDYYEEWFGKFLDGTIIGANERILDILNELAEMTNGDEEYKREETVIIESNMDEKNETEEDGFITTTAKEESKTTETVTLESKDHYISLVRDALKYNDELRCIKDEITTRGRVCRRLLKRNMLEIPEDIYQEWENQLMATALFLETYFEVETPVHYENDVMQWSWPIVEAIEIDVDYDNQLLEYYNDFFEYCRKYVMPHIQG